MKTIRQWEFSRGDALFSGSSLVSSATIFLRTLNPSHHPEPHCPVSSHHGLQPGLFLYLLRLLLVFALQPVITTVPIKIMLKWSQIMCPTLPISLGEKSKRWPWCTEVQAPPLWTYLHYSVPTTGHLLCLLWFDCFSLDNDFFFAFLFLFAFLWNAKVGSQEIPGVTGKFGLGVQNEAGQSLTDCCLEKKTDHSKHHLPTNKRQLCTWTSPDSQCWNQIDYTFCSQSWRSSIQSAKTRSGADCGSDHGLLVAKFRLKLKKVGKTTKLFRYDFNQSLMIIKWKWEIDSRD